MTTRNKSVLILGIDTSCDDTSASLVEFGQGQEQKTKTPRIISNVISSQAGIHAKYGGIVPELASRRHIEMIWPVVKEAMGNTGLEELSAIAVCSGPGLIGSLLVGCSFAKAVSFSQNIPLLGINHLEGHILSVFIENSPEFPFISLVVSGGHTSLYLASGFLDYTELGKSRDDAAGEAYDKVAKLLSLGYPGGPKIDTLASEGNPKAVRFPRAYLPGSFDFSFSGLKTAVVNFLNEQREKNSGRIPVNDIAASFQAAVVDVLIRKCRNAIQNTGIKRLAIAGGVSSNSALKEGMRVMTEEVGARLFIPSPVFCTDNAAMIAVAGYHRLMAGQLAGPGLNPKPSLKL